MNSVAADASSAYLGTLPVVPYAVLTALPDHPAQRQTKLHAFDLLKSGVLKHQLDIHRQIDAVLVGDIAAMTSAFATDPLAAVDRHGILLNGHSRRWSWDRGYYPKPETLRLVVHFAANPEASLALYNAFDAQAAVKGAKDQMQSTLNVADITPQHELVTTASNLQPALQWAVSVLCGSLDKLYRGLRPERIDPRLITMEPDFYRSLPHLGAVQLFKDAIIALDDIDLTTKGEIIPVSPAGFLGAYLTILYRNPIEGREFLERCKDIDSGEANGTVMDAFAVVKRVRAYYADTGNRSFRKMHPTTRQARILNHILLAFHGWLADRDYQTEGFPSRPNVIATFNPLLKREADAFIERQEQAKARANAENQQRRPRRTPPEPLPPVPVAAAPTG